MPTATPATGTTTRTSTAPLTEKDQPTEGGLPPAFDSGLRHSENCTQCSKIGILRLQPDQALVKKMIGDLVADGNTDAPQGLFWAWEVLMPRPCPFDEAVVDPPFQRAQAIVFMTDGQNVGGNGDAYHGWFGSGNGAGTLGGKGKITLPDGSSVDNNLNNRLLQLAQKIKGVPTQNPLDDSTVKIYVIQYQEKMKILKRCCRRSRRRTQVPFTSSRRTPHRSTVSSRRSPTACPPCASSSNRSTGCATRLQEKHPPETALAGVFMNGPISGPHHLRRRVQLRLRIRARLPGNCHEIVVAGPGVGNRVELRSVVDQGREDRGVLEENFRGQQFFIGGGSQIDGQPPPR